MALLIPHFVGQLFTQDQGSHIYFERSWTAVDGKSYDYGFTRVLEGKEVRELLESDNSKLVQCILVKVHVFANSDAPFQEIVLTRGNIYHGKVGWDKKSDLL